MTQRGATFVAFLAASSIPPAIMALYSMVMEHPTIVQDPPEALLRTGLFFVAFLPTSAILIALLGLPAFLLCRRLGIVTWWLALGFGVLGGLLVSWIMPPKDYLESALLYVPAAAGAGLTFWIVWRRASRAGE